MIEMQTCKRRVRIKPRLNPWNVDFFPSFSGIILMEQKKEWEKGDPDSV